MTYLSRVFLNPLRTGAQAMLRNPERMHAAVLGGVARRPLTERVLWRAETRERHRIEVLILTESRPSWEHLVEQAGWPNAEDPQALVRDYQPLLDRVQTGRQFAFRLRANPVSATRHPSSPSVAQKERLAGPRPRGVRVPHRTAGHQLAWLTEPQRTERWGISFDNSGSEPTVHLTGRERLTFHKKPPEGGNGKGSHVVLSTATFDGFLRVVDAELARRTLLQGIGPAKAYGCGLLTLAPIPGSPTPPRHGD